MDKVLGCGEKKNYFFSLILFSICFVLFIFYFYLFLFIFILF